MYYEIDDMLKESYNHAVALNLQQKGSKLSSCVREEWQATERYFFDQIAPTEAIDITSRHADTPLVKTKHDRRMLTLITSDWADLLDKTDQLKFISDPTSAYALNAAYALGRKKDTRIIQAALGTAQSGPTGDISVAFPDEQVIAVNFADTQTKVSSTNTGLTIAKLRMARQMLDDAEVDDDEEQYCVVTAKQINDLLKTTEVTSEDYNTVRALVEGKINTFMGFVFKRVSAHLLPKNENKARAVICFAKSGIALSTNGGVKTEISTRSDKRMAVQIYASISCGAVRMDEKKVVKVLCQE